MLPFLYIYIYTHTHNAGIYIYTHTHTQNHLKLSPLHTYCTKWNQIQTAHQISSTQIANFVRWAQHILLSHTSVTLNEGQGHSPWSQNAKLRVDWNTVASSLLVITSYALYVHAVVFLLEFRFLVFHIFFYPEVVVFQLSWPNGAVNHTVMKCVMLQYQIM